MGYTQRTATLFVRDARDVPHLNAREVVFTYDIRSGTASSRLCLERSVYGVLENPGLLKPITDRFEAFCRSINLGGMIEKRIIVVLRFVVFFDEEFFIEQCYRSGQSSFFNRIYDKASLAVDKMNEEAVIMCASSLATHYTLFK